MIAAGAYALAVPVSVDIDYHENDEEAAEEREEKEKDDEKDGVDQPAGSKASLQTFTPLPIQFSQDKWPNFEGKVGSVIVTKQKVVVNMILHVADERHLTLWIDNNSEDNQIFYIKANAPSTVVLDMDQISNGGVWIVGLVGHNEWLAKVMPGAENRFNVEIAVTKPGSFPVTIELVSSSR
jgi:hypothetical protein